MSQGPLLAPGSGVQTLRASSGEEWNGEPGELHLSAAVVPLGLHEVPFVPGSSSCSSWAALPSCPEGSHLRRPVYRLPTQRCAQLSHAAERGVGAHKCSVHASHPAADAVNACPTRCLGPPRAGDYAVRAHTLLAGTILVEGEHNLQRDVVDCASSCTGGCTAFNFCDSDVGGKHMAGGCKGRSQRWSRSERPASTHKVVMVQPTSSPSSAGRLPVGHRWHP